MYRMPQDEWTFQVQGLWARLQVGLHGLFTAEARWGRTPSSRGESRQELQCCPVLILHIDTEMEWQILRKDFTFGSGPAHSTGPRW